jgi:serine/threonine protein kinase
LKRLYSTNEKDFELEVEMLKAFSHHQQPHLVKLLATYLLKGRFYLMFPFAPCNLRGYWQRTPTAEFSYTTVKWMLAQCKGIASGLMAIHEYQSTLAQASGDGDVTPRQGDHLGENLKGQSGDGKKHIYGRHGDIKPENILWSEEDIKDEDGDYNEQGLLLIADFGLMDFHGKQTRSAIDPETINGSPTYEPPERRLRVKISRAYDIWSLGCVYLEFVTWLVTGWDELAKFPDLRGKTSLNHPINDDTFFTIIEDGQRSSPRAIVREMVTEWIKDLHEKPRCSDFIHDFLDLVSKEMLVVEASRRIHCGPLNDRLLKMLKKAKENSLYLIEPRPSPPRERSEIARRMSETARQGKDYDSPPPSPTEGSALPRRNLVTANIDSVTGSSPPSRPMSPLVLVSAAD